jgi:hypothetical protein
MKTVPTTTQLRKEHDADLAEARKERNKIVRREDNEKREKIITGKPVKK